jgi:hypothetical protein
MKRCNRMGRICLVLAAVCVVPAIAQIRGEYSPGSTLSGAGDVPDPGFSYNNQFWYNTADRLYGPDGKPRPDKDNFFALTDNNTFIFVPKPRLWDAKMEFMVDLAFSTSRFDSISPLTGDPIGVGAVGISNTNFVPFDLSWSLKRVDLMAGLSVYAPTGRYQPHARDNLSSGYWTLGPQVGATIYLSRSKSNQASLYSYYAFNTREQRTQTTPGQNQSLDYSLSHTFSLGHSEKWSLLAGPAGYGQWQTTANQRPHSQDLRYTIDAVGFTINLSTPYKGFSIGTSQLWEYGAHETYEGRTSVVTGSINF